MEVCFSDWTKAEGSVTDEAVADSLAIPATEASVRGFEPSRVVSAKLLPCVEAVGLALLAEVVEGDTLGEGEGVGDAGGA